MEKIHDLSFCPSCGSKLNGDETVCPFCGYRLLEAEKQFGIKAPETPSAPIEPPAEVVAPVVEPPVEVVAPVVEPPVEEIRPEVIETPPPPVIPVPEKKHDLVFCPECGAKLDGTETVCLMCGYNLVENHDPIVETPVTPKEVPVEKVVPPPPAAPAAPEKIKAATPVTPVVTAPVPKKKRHTGLIIFLILLFLILAGAAATAYLQYAGTINVPFLAKFIPSNKPVVVAPTVEKNYYFCYSVNHTMKDQIIIVSSVFFQTEKGNSKVTAGNAFKKLVNIQYPKDHIYFNNVITMKYSRFEDAVKDREKTKNDYLKRKFKIRYIEIH